LRSEGIEPTLYWYNPNIHPFKEYEMRRDTLTEYAGKIGVALIVEDEYGLDEFCKNVSSSLKTRCVDYCYPVRLRRTFEYAKENGFDAVSTTLLYSIYQNHGFIKKYCEDLSAEYGIEFLYRDFRFGFWEGHEAAIGAGLYMQKYCGCIFSEESRYLGKETQKPCLPEGCEMPGKPSLQINKEQDGNTEIYSLRRDGETLASAELLRLDGSAVEIKNLSETVEGGGYAGRLLKSLCGSFRQKYGKMLVGAKEKDIPFYVKLGFDRYEKTENGLIYYSKEL
jgi:predicted adenine nucleotide alpha hydrolase (AANH) superfamily ATPase